MQVIILQRDQFSLGCFFTVEYYNPQPYAYTCVPVPVKWRMKLKQSECLLRGQVLEKWSSFPSLIVLHNVVVLLN